MPRTRRRKGAAATGSSAEMPQKKAAAVASSGGVAVVHPEKGAAGSVSCSGSTRGMSVGSPTMDPGEVSAAASVLTPGMSGGALSMDPGEVPAAGSVSTREMSGGASRMDPGKVSAVSDSSGCMLQKKAAPAALSGGGQAMDPWEGPPVSDSIEGVLQKKADLSRGAPTNDPGIVPAVSDSMEGMLQKKVAVDSSGGSAASGALHGNTTTQYCEETAAKHRTKKARIVSTLPHEHCTEDEGDVGLSPKDDADTGLVVNLRHEHVSEEADIATVIQESDSNEIVHVKEEETHVHEAELLIQEMDACGIGEAISDEEFLGYFNRLPPPPPWIDLEDTLEDDEMDKQEVRLALYRLRYLKHMFLEQASKEELQDDKLKSLLDKSEDDCNQKFLEEEGFFRRFEEDWTLDWFIHPDYEDCSSLTDYQRLVLRNHGGTEYSKWSEYHRHLHSYKIEKEYVTYCEELSKKLKWMESYLDTKPSSVKWGYISSRAALQAIKIAATDFQEITPTLAYNGFYECKESMAYDRTWFEFDGVYFEIWRRVTQQPMSFKEALEEVYKLDRFTVHKGLMKAALEDDYTLKWMEKEFQTCISAITSAEEEDEAKELLAEDKAKELIAEAVKKLVDTPKSYEQYIRKKIEIARIVRIPLDD